MSNQLYKYELNPGVLEYLLRAVNSQQIKGEQQAKDLVSVLDLLRNPVNATELEKQKLEDLKSKLEPITKEKKKK